jgi:hypothetical protein
MTADEFIKREMTLYGEDEIWSLIDKGYVPKLTDHGWRWNLVVDTGENLCYNGSLGSRRTPVRSGIRTRDRIGV